MVMTTGQFGKKLEPGVKSWYGLEYNQYPLEYKEIFDTETSKKHFEELVSLVGFGLFEQVDEGDAINFMDGQQGYNKTVYHNKYGLGFKITQEMIDDDIYESIAKQYTKALARSEVQTSETVAAAVLNNGFSSATGPDGVALLSASHPNASGNGTQSNILAVASDLNEAALEQIDINIGGFTDDAGLKIAVKPKKLVIPKELKFIATRVLQSTLRPATANNDPNALRILSTIPEGYTVNHWLSDTDAWFVKTDCPNGLIHYVRKRSNGPDLMNEFETEVAKFKMTKREVFTFFDWRCIAGSPGA